MLYDAVLAKGIEPPGVFILAPGAFLVVGLLLGWFNYRKIAKGGA